MECFFFLRRSTICVIKCHAWDFLSFVENNAVNLLITASVIQDQMKIEKSNEREREKKTTFIMN